MKDATLTKEDAIRDFILQKSEELFIKNGYEETSMDMIARMCNLSKPTLYNYFKGKNELFLGVHVRHHERVYGTILDLLKQDKEPLDILEEIFDVTFRNYGEHSDFLKIFNLECHHLSHESLAEHIDWSISNRKAMSASIGKFLDKIVQSEAKKRFDVETISAVVLGMFETLLYDLSMTKSASIATYKEFLLYILKRSLLK